MEEVIPYICLMIVESYRKMVGNSTKEPGIMQEVQEDYILVKEISVGRNIGLIHIVENGSDKVEEIKFIEHGKNGAAQRCAALRI